jgi:hypothetical protein
LVSCNEMDVLVPRTGRSGGNYAFQVCDLQLTYHRFGRDLIRKLSSTCKVREGKLPSYNDLCNYERYVITRVGSSIPSLKSAVKIRA